MRFFHFLVRSFIIILKYFQEYRRKELVLENITLTLESEDANVRVRFPLQSILLAGQNISTFSDPIRGIGN